MNRAGGLSATGWIMLATLSPLAVSSCAKQAVRPEPAPSESRALDAPARGASRIFAFSVLQLELRVRPEQKRRILGPLGYLYVGAKWFRAY